MTRMNHARYAPATRHCQGFSMVEIMVAMVISLILLSGIAQIFLGSRQSFTLQNTLGRQQESGRFAANAIAGDLRRAGYWGGNSSVSGVTGTEPPVTPATRCNTGDNSWARMVEQRIFGLNHTETASLAAYQCINNGNGHSSHDVLVTRFASPWPVFLTPGPGQRPVENSGRLYFRSSLALSEVAGRIFKGSDISAPDNDMYGGAIAPLSERISELISRAYYIGPSGQTCNGVSVPSLYRESLDRNGRPIAEEIAYGIDDLQLRYGLDTNSDNSVDTYLDAGSSGLNEDSEWDQVIAVHFWLLTRAECPEPGYTNNNTYTMGDVAYIPGDSFRRQLYHSIVRLRNTRAITNKQEQAS